MQTVNLRSRVGRDGLLHLDIPSDYVEAELDVTVTVRPASAEEGEKRNWPPRFFEEVVGGWRGEPLRREGAESYEVREEF